MAAGLLLTITTMAAEHYSTVTIKSRNNFMIVVDGRTYYNDNHIRLDMRRGMHSIKVYERSRGFFGNRMRLVSSRNFFVRNNDLRITIGYNGFVDIDEKGNKRRNGRWDNDDRYDRDGRYGDRDRNDRDYDRKRRY
jgi:hypothetical protein